MKVKEAAYQLGFKSSITFEINDEDGFFRCFETKQSYSQSKESLEAIKNFVMYIENSISKFAFAIMDLRDQSRIRTMKYKHFA
eukprot:snap_masked-scaffold_111-processed-gene-0.6-mRNA-1 protein AED:1.00 eAED:1.00 QI:0/-1/0/0/-1/1/1/0/82